MRAKGKESEKELSQWWEDIIKKYEINLSESEKLHLDLRSNILFINV